MSLLPRLNPKQWTLLALLTLAGSHVVRYTAGETLPMFAAAVAGALAVDTVAELLRKRRLIVTSGAAITGVIIGSIVAPATSPIIAGGLAAGAMLVKHLVRHDGRPVFNPAALALFVGAAFFKVQLSWWAGSEDILTIILGSIVLAKLPGRWKLVAAYTGSSMLLAVLQAAILHRPILNVMSALILYQTYFVFFMLTDPRTSPIMPRSLPMFGLLSALGTFLSYFSFSASTLLSGLLFANFMTIYLNHHDLTKGALHAPQQVPTEPPKPVPWFLRAEIVAIILAALFAVAGATYYAGLVRRGEEAAPLFPATVPSSAPVQPADVGEPSVPSLAPETTAPTEGTNQAPVTPPAAEPKVWRGEVYDASGLLLKRNPDRLARDLGIQVIENGQKRILTLEFAASSRCFLGNREVACGQFRIGGAAFGTVVGQRTGDTVTVKTLKVLGNGDDEEEGGYDD